jgi:hypothetical protein
VITREVLQLIQDTPTAILPGTPATHDHDCQGSKFHSPRPMIVHRVEVPQQPGEHIYLCGTCADNYRLLTALEHTTSVPWPARRCFGNTIRAIVPQEPNRA